MRYSVLRQTSRSVCIAFAILNFKKDTKRHLRTASSVFDVSATMWTGRRNSLSHYGSLTRPWLRSVGSRKRCTYLQASVWQHSEWLWDISRMLIFTEEATWTSIRTCNSVRSPRNTSESLKPSNPRCNILLGNIRFLHDKRRHVYGIHCIHATHVPTTRH